MMNKVECQHIGQCTDARGWPVEYRAYLRKRGGMIVSRNKTPVQILGHRLGRVVPVVYQVSSFKMEQS